MALRGDTAEAPQEFERRMETNGAQWEPLRRGWCLGEVAVLSGGDAELFVVIGHAPRHLDRNDTLLALEEIGREAAAVDVDIAPILRDVAAMSSGVNRYGMGSTRDMLLKRCRER